MPSAKRIAVLVALASLALPAQSPDPSFDTASIKRGERGGRTYNFQPNKFSARNVSLTSLIDIAYDLPLMGFPRVSGGPAWVRTEHFEVEGFTELLADVPPRVRAAKMRLMLRILLTDRFKLALRTESKDLAVYTLTVAKGGPKLKPTSMDEEACTNAPWYACHTVNGGSGVGLHGKSVSLSDIARDISAFADRPIVDETGLEGLYDIDTLGWNDTHPSPGYVSPDEAFHNSGLPTLFNIFERLGLKLSPTRGPIEIYIITHADHP